MRLGCGCAVVVLVMGVLAGGAVWAVVKMSQTPRFLQASTSAQRQMERGGRLTPPGRSSVTMSDTDVAALITRQLRTRADVPVKEVVVRIAGSGAVDIAGRLTVRDVLRRPVILGHLVALAPASWRAYPVWIVVRVAPHVRRDDSRRNSYLTLEITRLAVGRLTLPTEAGGWIGAGLLRWELPETVEEISLEPGQVMVRVGSSRPRSEAGGRR